jgi:hypothetical protein
MADPKRHKAGEPAQASVCEDRGLLRLIFSFVGRGEWFFVAEVSHLWQQSYEQLWKSQEKDLATVTLLCQNSTTTTTRTH